MFQYTALTNDPNIRFMSKFVGANVNAGIESAKFRGSLLTLFGEPLYKSDDSEDAYMYYVEVKDRGQNAWIFSVYEGPSGPAIGYNGDKRNQEAKTAAYALIDSIESAPPRDFEEVVYYSDLGNKITYGCRNGICYYNEQVGDNNPLKLIK